MVTPSNVDKRQGLGKMAKFIKGKLFGDKGYISKALAEELWDKGVQWVTKIRHNIKPIGLGDFDKILLRKRFLIETINNQLKNIPQLEPASKFNRFYAQFCHRFSSLLFSA